MEFRQMKKGQPFERRYHGYNFTKSEINPKFYVRIEHTEPKGQLISKLLFSVFKAPKNQQFL